MSQIQAGGVRDQCENRVISGEKPVREKRLGTCVIRDSRSAAVPFLRNPESRYGILVL